MGIKTLEGKMIVKNKKVAIVVSRFNEFITNKLLSGAIDALKRHDIKEENITVAWVPGAFEVAYTAKKITDSAKYDGVICLGALIRGATPHFDYISNEATKGVAQLAMDSKVPVVYGIITCDTIEQAIERAGTKSGNKGFEAGLSLLEMISLFEQI